MFGLKCPSCGAEAGEPVKRWKYSRGRFDVAAYVCLKCGLNFRNYQSDKGRSFILALKEGRFRKVG